MIILTGFVWLTKDIRGFGNELSDYAKAESLLAT
jgi:hypothetical protein